MLKALGIDIGSSRTHVVYYLDKHEPKVLSFNFDPLPPAEWLSSVIAIHKNGKEYFGEEAKDWLEREPDNIRFISDFKRDILLDRPIAGFDDHRKLLVKMFERVRLELENLKFIEKNDFIDCYATLPSEVKPYKAKLYRDSAEKANLCIQMFLREPTAAYICENSQIKKDETVLVVDLGGGTVDYCAIKVFNGLAEQILEESISYDFGGIDIDTDIGLFLYNLYKNFDSFDDFFKYKISSEGKQFIRDNPILPILGERFKLNLLKTYLKEQICIINGPYGDKKLSYDITTHKNIINPYLQKYITKLERFRENFIKIHKTDFNNLYLCGGVSNDPIIYEGLKKWFDPNFKMNLEEFQLQSEHKVAEGAAISHLNKLDGRIGYSIGYQVDKGAITTIEKKNLISVLKRSKRNFEVFKKDVNNITLFFSFSEDPTSKEEWESEGVSHQYPFEEMVLKSKRELAKVKVVLHFDDLGYYIKIIDFDTNGKKIKRLYNSDIEGKSLARISYSFIREKVFQNIWQPLPSKISETCNTDHELKQFYHIKNIDDCGIYICSEKGMCDQYTERYCKRKIPRTGRFI